MVKKLFTILTLCVLSNAALAASLVAQGEGILIRIFDDRPCVLTDDPGLVGAEVVYQGRTLKACWKILSPSTIFVGDEEGDGGAVPAQAFKPESLI